MTISFRKRDPGVIELVDVAGPLEPGLVPEVEEVVSHEMFEAFYLREFPRILVLARAVAGADAAEDLAQETMLVAYRRWPEICCMESPGGYVRGICLHKSASVIRRLIAERRALQRYAARSVARLEPLLPDHEDFWSVVRALPRRQAQSAALFYALDLPVAEIATTLGCTEGTVKVHLSRARAALGHQLTESGEMS
jgi:RNA polymerase sigma-70 factor (ECF subfamily)